MGKNMKTAKKRSRASGNGQTLPFMFMPQFGHQMQPAPEKDEDSDGSSDQSDVSADALKKRGEKKALRKKEEKALTNSATYLGKLPKSRLQDFLTAIDTNFEV